MNKILKSFTMRIQKPSVDFQVKPFNFKNIHPIKVISSANIILYHETYLLLITYKQKFYNKSSKILFQLIDSVRSDECIDFTMLCFFFFFCLCTRERVEIMPQFQTMGVVSDAKMNVVGVLRSFFEFSNSFQKYREIPKKN
ncbi:Uncharacterized protein FWK35_00002632 [Aphis craccivora]|uniref:Uncharacterized protein n=1 Tax=Aphis craccivora TaxID=307492 RepID=A0A6G0ZS16_APHCR|nr:Uncharacterized protein FWK35_00002632 [Aphis craccivora]